MSFAKRAAQLLTNRYEMRKFAQEVEEGIPATDLEPGVQDFLGDDRGLEEAEDDARRRRRRSWAVLGALGGIGALGGLGYYGWKNRGNIASGIGSPDKLTIQPQADDKGLPMKHRLSSAVRDSIPGMSATEGAPSSALDRVTGGLGNTTIAGQAALRTLLRSEPGVKALDRLSGDPMQVDRYVRRTPGSLHGLRAALQETDPKVLQEAVKDSTAPRSRTRNLLGMAAGHVSEQSEGPKARQRIYRAAQGLENLDDIFRAAGNPSLPALTGSVRGTPQEAARALRDITSADLDRGSESDRRRLIRDLTGLRDSASSYDSRLSDTNSRFDTERNQLKAELAEVTTPNGKALRGQRDEAKRLRGEIARVEQAKAEAVSELDRQSAQQQRQRQALARALNPKAADRAAQSTALDRLIAVLEAPDAERKGPWGRTFGTTARATYRGVAPFAADRAANIGLRLFWDQQGDAPDRAERQREWERRRAQQGGGQ